MSGETVEFVIPAEPGQTFEPGSAAGLVGEPFHVEVEGRRVWSASVAAAEVRDDGKAIVVQVAL